MHIHSPFSELNNGFGDDFDNYVQTVFKTAIEKNIATIGITDYFTIEGYKKIKTEYLENESKLKELFSEEEINAIQKILVLPNIEFRLDKLVNSNRINYHIIFSDDVSIEDIEEDFLHELDFVYEGNPQDEDEKWKLKQRNLQDLGKKLKEDHPQFSGDSDLFVGMKCAVVDDKKITQLLRSKKSKFSGKYILVVPADEDLSKISWNSQGHNIRKVLIQKSDALFASNTNTINWALGGNNIEGYIKEFKSIKASFWGSDAHDFDSLFKPDGNRFCWIKADRTFEGLKQSIIEPNTRIFIGEKPSSITRVVNNPTKYIKALTISKKNGSSLEETWFDGTTSIPINHELVAIIGNKGNGKSAIADIIGLVGNSHNEQSFSFLTKNKFRKRNPNRAESFEAEITWNNNYTDECILSNPVDLSRPEKVKYLPQSYLEKLCTTTDETEFEQELKKVIFSHVEVSERLNKESLEDLIDYKSEEIYQKIEQIKLELLGINKRISLLEDKKQPDFIVKLQENLKAKEAEIKAHEEIKPKEVKEPEKDESVKQENAQITESINKLKTEQDSLIQQLENLNTEKSTHTSIKVELNKLKESLSNFMDSYQKLKNSSEPILTKHNLDFELVLKLQFDVTSIDNKVQVSTNRLSEIEKNLDIENSDSIVSKIKLNKDKIAELKNKLDEPSKKYQEYLESLKIWEQQLKSLIGDKVTPTTKIYLEESIQYIQNTLASDIEQAKSQRSASVKSIISEKNKIKQLYKNLYSPISSFINQYGEIVEDYEINVDVSLNQVNFSEKFFNYIGQGAKGSFIGKEEGVKKLKDLLSEADFASEEGIIEFLDLIITALETDQRDDKFEPRCLKNQLRQGFNPEEFYTFLFGLDYLEPSYRLKLSDKEVSQLSPGERGALLLIFYLLLDRQDCPLIIDQPEENLDNQSVYQILVRFIKEAKKKRQIIIVTHNPNLAVVCDADQVIHVKIDKMDKNRVSIISGSLENEEINNKVLEILEGTFPAFNNRTLKYKLHN